MGNQTQIERAVRGGEKSSRLTHLEDFDEGITSALVQTWSDETNAFDKPTRIEIDEDKDTPANKRLLTIKALGKTGLGCIMAEVDDQTLHIFPMPVPEPHLAYNRITSSSESDTDS